MTVIHRSMVVSYSPKEMYELVDGIEFYPEFLPWCQSTTIHSRTKDEVRASIYLAKGGMQYSFSTINRLQANKMIEVKLLSGPFRHLQGFWRFDEADNNGCLIHFDLDFVFSNRLLDLAAGPVLQGVTAGFIDAFKLRAEAIHGNTTFT
jgi:ribosome-associated toxin RatA of RatAB toxin-antitoxin module